MMFILSFSQFILTATFRTKQLVAQLHCATGSPQVLSKQTSKCGCCWVSAVKHVVKRYLCKCVDDHKLYPGEVRWVEASQYKLSTWYVTWVVSHEWQKKIWTLLSLCVSLSFYAVTHQYCCIFPLQRRPLEQLVLVTASSSRKKKFLSVSIYSFSIRGRPSAVIPKGRKSFFFLISYLLYCNAAAPLIAFIYTTLGNKPRFASRGFAICIAYSVPGSNESSDSAQTTTKNPNWE